MAEKPNDENRIQKTREKVGRIIWDWHPDYTKTIEENEQAYREGFYKIFGAYPEEIWPSKPINNS